MAADPMILHKYLLVEYNPAGEVRPSPIPTNDSPPSRMGSKHLGRQRRSARITNAEVVGIRLPTLSIQAPA